MSATYFRFGARIAGVESDDPGFLERFAENFRDCRVGEVPASSAPSFLRIRAADASPRVDARVEGFRGDLDPGLFARLFPELGLVRSTTQPDDRSIRFRSERHPDVEVALSFRADAIEIDRALPWQALIGHFFLHHVMREQPELVFLHAATVGLGDRGVLLCGEKGAGKSTLSVALAARGHAFLGDEFAAIDPVARRLLPFRRRASLRQGPQADSVARWLERHPVERETLPDGSVRARVQVSEMFDQAGAVPIPLVAAFFLGAREAQPSVRRIDFEFADLPHVSPLAATMSAVAPGQRALTFLKLFQSIPCFGLHPGGSPDQTADLIERAVEASWATA